MTIKGLIVMEIAASEFKAKCLKIMDHVNDSHEEVIVTKHGKPVVRIVSVSQSPSASLFGYMKNSVNIIGDIIKPIDEVWDVDS